MWAAKESAFKVARKLDRRARFLPRRFIVHFEGETSALVRHAVGRFRVSFSEGDDWVHAIATCPDGLAERLFSTARSLTRAPTARVERIRGSGWAAADLSARVREVARAALGSALSIAPTEIEIATAARVPVSLWRRSPLPVDLSLSHHGRFLACAWSRLEASPAPARSRSHHPPGVT